MSRRVRPISDRYRDINALESLPPGTVFEVGGHVFQRIIIALDSMPASIFRPSCEEIGKRGDRWEYAVKLIRDGYKLTIYEPCKGATVQEAE